MRFFLLLTSAMVYQLRIADLPSTERPRERLMAQGAKNLSSAELLAILLGTGQGPGKYIERRNRRILDG